MILSPNNNKVLFLNYFTFRSEEGEDTDQRIILYLKNKVKRIVHIAHPFPEFGCKYSYLTIYENGNKSSQTKFYVLRGPYLLQYLQHILITYYFLFKTGFVFDLCIVAANLTFFSIFPFRLFCFIKRIVYYSVDFVPQRFQNPLLNWLYHFLNRFACKHSDMNWVMTEKQIESNKIYGITDSNSSPFFLVPIGYETKNISILPTNKIDFYNLVYSGGLRESYGPQLAIKTMPLLIRKFPNIRLTIIGIGKYENELKSLIKELGIQKHIDFKGLVPSFKNLTDILSKKSIGLAPYAPIPGSYSYYSDPSKIKLYICCGLPVITTRVTTINSLISKTKSGIVIDFSTEALFKAISYLLTNKTRYDSFKRASIKLSEKFDINHILDNAFKNIPG